MKFKIINVEVDDSLIISGETIDKIIIDVKSEMKKRNWKEQDCYSVELESEGE